VTTDDAGAASPAPDDAQSWEPSADDIDFAMPADEPAPLALAREAGVQLPQAICALDAPPPEPITWAVDGLFLEREIGLLAGEGGSWKSTIGLHITAAAAGGYPVLNRFPTTPQPVLYVSEEDDAGVIGHRLEAIVVGQKWERDRSLRNVHILARAGASFTDPAWRAHLLGQICRLGAGLVFFDPWCDLLGGLDENSNTEVRPVIKYLRSLTEVGATPVVLHHVGKASDGKRSADRIRGASALLHGSRSIYFLEDRGDAIGIECLKLSRAPKLPPFTIARRIDSEPGNRAMWRSARFSAVSPKERATQFVLDELRDGSANTTDLKKAAVGKGVSGEDIGRALVALHESGEIAFEPAPRNEKRWYRVEQLDLARANGKLAKMTLPTLPDPALGKHAPPPSHTDAHLAPPKGGQAQWDRGNALAGQSGNLAPVDG